MDERKILVPFEKRECLSLKQAANIAGKSELTMRTWCENYGLGRQIGRTWSVSRVALAIYLDGDLKALRAYHAGDRTDARVVYYFEREGLGCCFTPVVDRRSALKWNEWARVPLNSIIVELSSWPTATEDGRLMTMSASSDLVRLLRRFR